MVNKVKLRPAKGGQENTTSQDSGTTKNLEPMKGPVKLSVFELFKVGPGPSSSHTIGPMLAGFDFIRRAEELPLETLKRVHRIDAALYGSLAATGAGHGTDRAVLAGLLGFAPDRCPAGFLDTLASAPRAPHYIDLGKHRLRIGLHDVRNAAVVNDYPHANTLVLRLLAGKSLQSESLFEMEYYSIGGGFIEWKGYVAPERGEPVHPYANAQELIKELRDNDLPLDVLVMDNEMAITGASEETINHKLDFILGAMEKSVQRGINAHGVLPGPIGLMRKAAGVQERSLAMHSQVKRFLGLLNAYAFAGAEENAAGQPSVTAPTLGSCGVVPAVNQLLKDQLRVSKADRRRGLLAAAAVGFLAMHNASIAGAEVGCQGEVGVASSMAAAMLAHSMGLPRRCVLNAAESALEHHLGMTCDPVLGYVQVPCVERNAMGAVKAYNAYLLSEVVMPEWHKVDLDKTIRAMAETGRDMCPKYKETSQGGLAATVTC